MLSRENAVLATSILVGTVLIGVIVLTGLFDEWQAALSFILFGLFWFAIPQLYLAINVEDDLSRTRLGVASVVLLLFATAASASASLRESALIWGLVAIAFGVIIVHQFRAGYESSGAAGQPE